MEQTQPKTPKTELQKNLGYFSAYKKLPIIVAVSVLVLSFVWGIVDPCIFNGYSYYGIMELPNGFLCWMIWMLIGAVVAVGEYFFLRIVFSHKLLQIHYLQRIANERKVD